jgi:small-conductance mechanosensitive channel
MFKQILWSLMSVGRRASFMASIRMNLDFRQGLSTLLPAIIPPVILAVFVTLLVGLLPAMSDGAFVQAAEQKAPTDTMEEEESISAFVVIDGQKLFRVRGVSSYPAEQRAQVIAGRIQAIAADGPVSAESVHVVDAGDRTRIMAADRLVMVVFDADAALEDIPRLALAEIHMTRVRETINAYRQDRNPRVLINHTLYALGATVLLVLILFGVRWAFGRLRAVTERRYKAKIHGVEFKSFRIIEAERLWAAFLMVLRLLQSLVILVFIFIYVEFVLSLYPWTRSLAKNLLDIVLDPLRTMGSAILGTMDNIVFLVLLVIVVRYVLKLIRLFFTAVEQGRVTVSGFDREWAPPTYRIVRLLVIAFAAVVAYPYIPGSDSAAFKGVSIFLGVVFSLGSTSVIANMVAGYTMTYRRAFRIGDRVKIADIVGDVTEIRISVTHIRSLKNEEIVVPNSMILNNEVVNYSALARERGLILHTTVGIGYETPWRQVEAMLLEAARRTPGLLREPAPFVLQKSLGDFAVNYEINAYCDQPLQMLQLYTALHRNILDLFNEYGVQIMTPAYEGDPAEPKIVPKDQWFESPAQSHSETERQDISKAPPTGTDQK